MEQPFILMIAGPNGSGKTTLTNWLRRQGIDFGEYINPDDIAATLDGTYEERTRQAQQVADQRRDDCIAAKRSFSFETVMSHHSKVDILARARESGFFVQVFFVGTDDPQTNIDRVALRVAQGGHDVPTSKIASRWRRTMEQLSDAIRAADQVFVFDNSVSGTVETVPRLVFHRAFTKGRNLPESRQSYPVPRWVRQYVLSPLGIGVTQFYPKFAKSLPSLVSLPVTMTTRAGTEAHGQFPDDKHGSGAAEQAAAARRTQVISPEETSTTGGLQSFSRTLISAIDMAAQAYSRDGTTVGLTTGFRDLDQMLGGLQPSNFVVIAGLAGMGKTTLATNIAYNIASAWAAELDREGQLARKAGGIVGLFSFEMSSEQIATRIISSETGIPAHLIFGGNFAGEDFDKIANAARKMETAPLYIDDTGGISIKQLASRAKRLLDEHGLDLLVVDTVQALQISTGRLTGATLSRMSSITAGLKSLAKELKIPILAVSQSTRAKSSREARPQRIEVDASLEQDADVILILNREEHDLRSAEPLFGTYEYFQWQEQMEQAHRKAELFIRKNRHGPTGFVLLDFDGQVARFNNLN